MAAGKYIVILDCETIKSDLSFCNPIYSNLTICELCVQVFDHDKHNVLIAIAAQKSPKECRALCGLCGHSARSGVTLTSQDFTAEVAKKRRQER
jgi:hypothetical protein